MFCIKYFLTAGLFIMISLSSRAQIINTVAGNGTSGDCGNGGPALQACIDWPHQITTDRFGNIYFTDKDNNKVKLVSNTGIITTIAGTGQPGFSGDGDSAVKAQINYPIGIAVDTMGNVYFSDGLNQRIRKISTAGIITTVAGTGIAGYNGDNIRADTSQLSYPCGIAFDRNWNLIIADAGDYRLRNISRNGIITTIAGTGQSGYTGDNGPALQAKLSTPFVICTNKSGELYYADFDRFSVRKILPNGTISTFAGDTINGYLGDGGPATNARLSYISGLAVDENGELFISDSGNDRIRKVNINGIISTFAGSGSGVHSGDGGMATNAGISYPNGICVDITHRYLYLNELLGNTVRQITLPPLSVSNTAHTSRHSLAAYPNPVSDVLHIGWSPSSKQSTIKVLNVLGQVMAEQASGADKATINMSGFASGVYNVLLICDGNIVDATTIQKQ